MLQDNGGDNLTVAASGTTPFATKIAAGGAYAVTVLTQPSTPPQVCTVTAGTGTANANVTVTVTCVSQYTISANVVGLAGSVVLQDNGSDNLTVAASGTTPFATKIAAGGAYAVTVLTQPAAQICTVAAGTGTANANVTVTITCVNQYTISAHVVGLAGTVVLRDNGADNLTVSTVGTSTTPFATKIAAGGAYAVTVFTQPAAQICTVAAGTGTANANVTVTITCVNQYTISAHVVGLASSVVLQDNGADNLTVSTVGTSTTPFATKIAAGGAYAVTVLTQPTSPAQFCTVAAGTGTANANVTVTITCTNVGKYVFVTNPYDTPGSVAAFTITATTGALTPVAGSPYASMESAPYGVALDPSGNYLYITDNGSPNLATFSIGALGVLTPDVSIATTGSLTNVSFGVQTSKVGANTYVYASSDDTSGTLESFTANESTGVLAPANGTLAASTYPAGSIPYGFALDPTGSYLYAANFFDGTVDEYSATAGVLAPLNASPDTTLASPYGVVASPNGLFVYITDQSTSTVQEYSYVNTGPLGTAGTLTPLTGPGTAGTVGLNPEGVAIDPTGSFLYVSNSGDGTVSAFTIDPSTGNLTSVHAAYPTGATVVPSTATPTTLAVDPSTQYLYVANGDDGTISVFKITAVTGALTAVGSPVSCITAGGGPSSIVVQ